MFVDLKQINARIAFKTARIGPAKWRVTVSGSYGL